MSDNENFISTTDECSDESGLLGQRKLSHNLEEENSTKRMKMSSYHDISSEDETI